MTRGLTPDEVRAVAALRRLARRWPATLKLFAWSGTLVVMDAAMEPGEAASLDTIAGIPCDGGDPG